MFPQKLFYFWRSKLIASLAFAYTCSQMNVTGHIAFTNDWTGRQNGKSQTSPSIVEKNLSAYPPAAEFAQQKNCPKSDGMNERSRHKEFDQNMLNTTAGKNEAWK